MNASALDGIINIGFGESLSWGTRFNLMADSPQHVIFFDSWFTDGWSLNIDDWALMIDHWWLLIDGWWLTMNDCSLMIGHRWLIIDDWPVMVDLNGWLIREPNHTKLSNNWEPTPRIASQSILNAQPITACKKSHNI